MIWFDVVTPKSVLFFAPMIRELERRGYDVLVTGRGGEDYREVRGLLEDSGLEYHLVGEYGGLELEGKLRESLRRQQALISLLREAKCERLVSLCSVDAVRVAFGLGIPVVSFCDLANRGEGTPYTEVARLTLPLSRKILHPFVVPSSLFSPFVGGDLVRSYAFLDPVIYLRHQEPDPSHLESMGLNRSRQLVVFREEEYKASYVQRKVPFAYEAMKTLQDLHNLVVIPRYGPAELKRLLPRALVVPEPLPLSRLLPFADLFVGGGGTINIEAAWWEVPVISTRSFVSHYDRYLIDHGLMTLASDTDAVLRSSERLIGRRVRSDVLRKQVVDMDYLMENILED